MNLLVEIVRPDTPSPMMTLNNPPAIPSVGDITVGPDGELLRVVQRAFLIEDQESKLVLSAQTRSVPTLVFQCVVVPVEMAEAVDRDDVRIDHGGNEYIN